MVGGCLTDDAQGPMTSKFEQAFWSSLALNYLTLICYTAYIETQMADTAKKMNRAD